jgi:hypothetical protein
MFAREHELAFFVGHAMLKGWARVRQGEGEEAIAPVFGGASLPTVPTGMELESSYWFALLGEACATFGAVDEGLAALTESLDLVATTGARFCHAELFRLKGELLLKRAQPNQTEGRFMKRSALRGAIFVILIIYTKWLSNSRVPAVEALMRCKPKSLAALHIALGRLPDRMQVKVDPNTGVSAKTVGELRKLTVWPENLTIATPLDPYPGSIVSVSKASVATRVVRKS